MSKVNPIKTRFHPLVPLNHENLEEYKCFEELTVHELSCIFSGFLPVNCKLFKFRNITEEEFKQINDFQEKYHKIKSFINRQFSNEIDIYIMHNLFLEDHSDALLNLHDVINKIEKYPYVKSWVIEELKTEKPKENQNKQTKTSNESPVRKWLIELLLQKEKELNPEISQTEAVTNIQNKIESRIGSLEKFSSSTIEVIWRDLYEKNPVAVSRQKNKLNKGN